MRYPSVSRFTMLSFVAVLLFLLGVLVGCGGGGQEREEGASITATPNPVPTGGRGPGTTTINWSTGGEASSGEIYVSTNGGREKLFAGESPQGAQDADWIWPNTVYEFRLYAGTKRATLLDKVTVKTKTSEQTQEQTQESTTKEKTQANGTEEELSTTLLASAEDGLSILLPTAVLLLLIGNAVLRRR
jgi:hypothetical protein